ncbi:MAG: regulatory protein YycI of two-component signal transduction system YycFG, partial [Candidatus Endobugula sp.]
MYLSKVSKQYVVVVVLLLLAIFSSVIYVNKNVSAPLVGEIVDQAIKKDAAKHEV